MTYFDIRMSTEKGPIIVAWNNSVHLKYFSRKQNPVKFKLTNFDNDIEFQTKLQWWSTEWNMFKKNEYFTLPNNSVVVDIGSGIGILPLLTYQYLKLENKKSTFYLIDRQQNSDITLDFTEGNVYGFFNHWEPLTNAISSNDMDKDCFKILDPVDIFPDQSDLILSRRSWCYHYPYSFYRDKMLSSLKVGGKLGLDVYNDSMQLEEISKDMNSDPIYRIDWTAVSTVTKQVRKISTCLWIRK